MRQGRRSWIPRMAQFHGMKTMGFLFTLKNAIRNLRSSYRTAVYTMALMIEATFVYQAPPITTSTQNAIIGAPTTDQRNQKGGRVN